MRQQILSGLNDPAQLEHLYRENKSSFKDQFFALYPEISDNPHAAFWKERLSYSGKEINWGSGKELIIVILAALIAGLIAKLPAFFGIDEEFFYPRNLGFIVFPVLAAYFAWKNNLSKTKVIGIAITMLVALVYINNLPNHPENDTLILVCIHLLVFLWFLLGIAFVGEQKESSGRLGFLKFNGDLVVLSALICIAGGIVTAVTIGLFQLIGLNIEEFYFNNVVVFGLPAVPVSASFLNNTNPQLVGKVSPVIARLFSPVVLVMLGIYLGAMAFSGKDPYSDREFLLIFNILLIGVMALIFFSIAEDSGTEKTKPEIWILAFLSLVTVVVNGVALSAIIFRISEWGITPNRLAVLGANVLILINLLLLTFQLFRAAAKNSELNKVRSTIAQYLPVYFVWVLFVTFFFPLIFGIN